MSKPRWLLFACILLQAALTLTFSLTLRYELKTSAYDGALFAQLLYNIVSGNGFISTLAPPHVAQNFLGVHFSPILYALAPIYYLFPHVETLLVILSGALALAAWPIFRCAEKLLQSPWQALLIALLYLTNPYIINAAMWDFHEVALAPLCIACMFLALLNRNRALFGVLAVALIFIKEHYGLAVAGFGLLWAWQWKDKRFGLGIAAAGIAALVMILFVLMPYVSVSGKPAMMDAASSIDRFSWLSDPLANGKRIAEAIIGGIFYLVFLLIPLLFVPITALLWMLPGLADFAINSLSIIPMQQSYFSYHSAALIPVIVIACAAALGNRGFVSVPRFILVAIAPLALLYSISLLALPYSKDNNVWEFSAPRLALRPGDKAAVHHIRELIPADAIVSVQNNAVPHVGPYPQMWHFPNKVGDAEFIVLHLGFPFKEQSSVFNSPYGVNSAEDYFSAVRELLSDSSWGVVLFENQWLLLKRNANDKANRQAARKALADTEKLQRSLEKD